MLNPFEEAFVETIRSGQLKEENLLDAYLDDRADAELENYVQAFSLLADRASFKLENRAMERKGDALEAALYALEKLGIDWSNVDIDKTVHTGKLSVKGQ